MKNILTIVLIAFLGSATYAQSAASAPVAVSPKAKVESAAKFEAGKTKGTYEFLMPATVIAENVKKTAAYYTQYFTVKFDNKTKVAQIAMVQNDDKAKRVIVRFLVANGVKEITMDGKDYSVEDFFTTHIAK